VRLSAQDIILLLATGLRISDIHRESLEMNRREHIHMQLM